MKDASFWSLWALTMALCAWKLIEGFVRPHRMLEWPFLACAMWAYFYGYMGFDAKIYLSNYLPGEMAVLGQTMALLCLAAVLIGWKLGLQETRPAPAPPQNHSLGRIWLIGQFFVIVGAVGGIWVMRANNSGTLNYQETSAYWYLLFYVGYPGLSMTIWALCKMNSSARVYLLAISILTFCAFMFPHVFNARRGPLFPAIMILLLVPPLARRKSPHPLIFFGGLVAAGLVMLLFLQIRTVTYNGGSWSQALQNVDVASAVTDRGEQAEDNEYVNSCQLIGTVYRNGKYQYGTGHLSLLFHWIPRSIWKDKPTLGEGSYSFDQMFDDVESVTGFHLLGTGASSGGIADTFVQYGVFCPVFWFGLSWLMGSVYVRARVGDSHRWLFCYVGFVGASHWLVSQSFSAAFVPGLFFQAVPFVVFLLFDPPPRPAAVRARPGLARGHTASQPASP